MKNIFPWIVTLGLPLAAVTCFGFANHLSQTYFDLKLPFVALAGAVLASLWCVQPILDRLDGSFAVSPQPNKQESVPKPKSYDEAARRDKFLTFLCEICIAAARRVGPIERGHIRLTRETLSHRLTLTPRDLDAIRGFLKSAISRPLSEVAAPLGARITELGLPRDSKDWPGIVEFVVGVATLGRSEIPDAARAFLRELAAEVGISRPDLDRQIEQQLYKHGRDPRADDLAVLGLGIGATRDAIKAAYRALAKKWHPDMAGDTPETRRRFLQIQRAYEALMKHERAEAA